MFNYIKYRNVLVVKYIPYIPIIILMTLTDPGHDS